MWRGADKAPKLKEKIGYLEKKYKVYVTQPGGKLTCRTSIFRTESERPCKAPISLLAGQPVTNYGLQRANV